MLALIGGIARQQFHLESMRIISAQITAIFERFSAFLCTFASKTNYLDKMKKLMTLAALLMLLSIGSRAENYPYRSDYLWLTLPDHADWLYQTGEHAKVEVTFCRYGIPQNVTVDYEIGPDMMPATKKGSAKLKNGRTTIDIGTLKKPGFLDLRLSASVDGTKYEHHVKVGFSPDKLVPYTQNPADFDDFWKKNLEEARRTPLQVSKKKVDAYTTDDFDCYLLKIRTDRRHSVYGYLTVPKWACSERRCPVVLCPPGAGIKTIKEPMRNTYYAKNGFIRLEMEIHGLNPELTDDIAPRVGRHQRGRARGQSGWSPGAHHGWSGPASHRLRGQSSGPERHGWLPGQPRRRLSALQPREQDAHTGESEDDAILRRGEFRTTHQLPHLSYMGLQRQRMPPNDQLHCVEPDQSTEGIACHTHQRALDDNRNQPGTDALDQEAPALNRAVRRSLCGCWQPFLSSEKSEQKVRFRALRVPSF